MGLLKSDMSKECDKAARILKSFVDKHKIPVEAVASAKGIAIFNGVRAGAMFLAGAGGSGVVVARLPDGSWSPPSAFSVRSGSVGYVYGIDIYDCICVLNTNTAVLAYTKPEVHLGGAAELAVGPASASTTEMKGSQKDVWVYTKSKGLYGGVTVEGSIIKEKAEVNAEFYGEKVSCKQILGGEVAAQVGDGKWPQGALKLHEMLKVAEGKSADVKVLQDISNEPTPGDQVEPSYT